ncbi:hypothetical protein C4N9_20260 [Pararhodobacter marinus]|uniref:Aspartate carbamoyltransferase catalytic subunit n=1 Tax=Pararhodobacter marinus TaxID=2184063 RepID=A0A2U2C4P2_9RHOB|nr:hypothetical protein [Pararhodobacter marinus]PWE26774.1 hypothetical protein C4N9_20260 [Pararhodobacter marinus]
MSKVPAGWEGILDEGEQILWQDRPDGRLRPGDFFGFKLVFAIFFTGFAVLWIAGARWMSPTDGFDLFPLFGVPFVLVGLYMMIGAPIWEAHVRRNTWYTLTDRAAFIATDLRGKRKLERHGFEDMNALSLAEGNPGTVWFRRQTSSYTTTTPHRSLPGPGVVPGMPGGVGGRHRRTRTTTTYKGFERITDARRVYGLLLRAKAAREEAASAGKDAGDDTGRGD